MMGKARRDEEKKTQTVATDVTIVDRCCTLSIQCNRPMMLSDDKTHHE